MKSDSIDESIRRRGLATIVVRGGGMVLLFLMHTVVARSTHPEGYGTFSFAVMLAALAASLASLGWPTALIRFVSEYDQSQSWSLLKGVIQRAFQVALFAGGGAAVLMVLASLILPLDGELRRAVLYAALITPLLALVGIRRSTFQGLHRSVSSVVPDEVLLPFLVIVLVVLLQPSEAGAVVWIYAAASLVVFALAGSWLMRWIPAEARRAPPEFHTRFWMTTALPMAVGGLGFFVLNRTGTVMLGALRDMEAVGLYAAAFRFAALITLVLGTVEIIASPMLSAAYHGGRESDFWAIFRSSRKWTLAGSLPLFVVLEAFPSELLTLFGAEFSEGSSVLRILAAGQLVNALTGPVGRALMMTGHQRTTARVTVAVALGNIIANAVAIPAAGATGAALVTAASIAALNLTFWWCLVKRVERPGRGISR